MGPGSPDPRQALVQRVLGQSVREAVAARYVRMLAHEGDGGRSVEDFEHPLLAEVGYEVEQVEVEVPSDDRGHGKDPTCLCTEPADAGGDDFSHAVGQHHLGHFPCRRPAATIVLVDGAGLHETPQHLSDEERVAFGLETERMGQVQSRPPRGVARLQPP